MKLNLLPNEVSKGGLLKVAVAASVLLVVASVLGALYLINFSKTEVTRAQERVTALKPLYDKAMATSKEADTIMASSIDLDRNLKLAEAMQLHNGKVVQLYDEVQSYLPSWFRMTSLTASPSDQATVVNISGVLYSYQQYADMMLALARIPDVVTVGRTGFTDPSKKTPGLIETDQRGTPIKPGETNLPSDPWERFNEMITRAGTAPSGYLNAGGFGSGEPVVRGTMPDWSAVTFSIVMNRNIQVPDPGATLRAGGAAGQAPAGAPAASNAAGGNQPGTNPVNNSGAGTGGTSAPAAAGGAGA